MTEIIILSIALLFIIIYFQLCINGLRKSVKILSKQLNETIEDTNKNLKQLQDLIKTTNESADIKVKTLENEFSEGLNSRQQSNEKRFQQLQDTMKSFSLNKNKIPEKNHSEEISELKKKISLNDSEIKKLNKQIRK